MRQQLAARPANGGSGTPTRTALKNPRAPCRRICTILKYAEVPPERNTALTGSSPPVPPFADAEEIPLAAAPIVRVLTQARYRGNVSRMDQAAADRFGDALADLLPFSENGQAIQILIGPDGVQQQQAGTPQWIFHDGGDRRVTLTGSWIAYDLGPYPGRAAYTEELSRILATLGEIIGAVAVARLGVRYINRIDHPDLLRQLPTLVRSELLGLLAAPNHTEKLLHSLSEALFKLDNAHLQVRHGLLPAGAVVDPTVTPVPRPSWTLDLDAYSDTAPPLGAGLAERTRELATIAYNYFHWAMRPEAIALFKEPHDAR